MHGIEKNLWRDERIVRRRNSKDESDLIGILHGTVGHFHFVEQDRLFHPLGTRLRTIRMDVIPTKNDPWSNSSYISEQVLPSIDVRLGFARDDPS